MFRCAFSEVTFVLMRDIWGSSFRRVCCRGASVLLQWTGPNRPSASRYRTPFPKLERRIGGWGRRMAPTLPSLGDDTDMPSPPGGLPANPPSRFVVSDSPESAPNRPCPDRPIRVLVADDEPVIRRTLAMMLETKGYQVELAASADEALALMNTALPDVALVDWKMPGGGESVVRALLGRPDFTGTILLVSGSMDDRATPFADKGVIRVRKPFSYPRLVDMVDMAGRGCLPVGAG
ncbi:MAG: hybrid sensor histidine kinase/response regulator [Gemmatimonadales bacterium]|nr:MAG: hybrid sensor histidine kinase/response regulator [Gemmatimonadales bacterium]